MASVITRGKVVPGRPVRLGLPGLKIERRADGCILAEYPHPLGAYPEKLTDRLDYWAKIAPERVFLAQRVPAASGVERPWRTISYSDFRGKVRRIGQALLNRGLSAERPLMVLSGNDIEHALLLHAAMYVGVPYAPVSPAYSLSVKEFTRLSEIMRVVQPGMVFASNLPAFAPALSAAPLAGAELVSTLPCVDLPSIDFQDLAETPETASVDEANSGINGDTVAKILFTSGSTNVPKGVVNTQRMLCSNQAMILSMLPCFGDEPPVTVDWLPWHHTFGGNHNLGIFLNNGGTLYIDEGRPVPGGFGPTAENLREIATTVYFNVPKGYEELVAWMRKDDILRKQFFSRIKLIFYAAASLSQAVRDELERLAIETCGERIAMVSAFGSTETAPFALCPVKQSNIAGFIGLPSPGVQLKLVPSGEKLEALVRGPNITPGYWKQPELTRAAFDEEGYYRLGDAMAFLDPEHPEEGFVFDGRVVEDFKLSSGTWVNVGVLRTNFVGHCAPYVQDAAIAGHDRDDLAALIFPNIEACRQKAGLSAQLTTAEVVSHSDVRAHFRGLLSEFARKSTGTSNRIVRAILMTDRPSLEAGEITDKGSLNQRATLRQRASWVEELYAPQPADHVITIG